MRHDRPRPLPGETAADYRARLAVQGCFPRSFSAEDRRLLRFLEDAGIETEQTQSRDILIVGAITRRTLTPSTTRRISMLPYYALQDAMDRAEMLDAIISDHPDRDTLRYEVLHPHEPCRAEALGERLDSVNDDVQAFSRATRRHGGQVVWTSIEAKHQDGGTYHVHANVIVQADDAAMQQIRRMADGRFGVNGWYDGGVIRDGNRVASYITKAPDLKAATPHEAVAYHRATEGRQLHRRAQGIPTTATDVVVPEETGAAEPLEEADREQLRSSPIRVALRAALKERENRRREMRRERNRNSTPLPIENRILRDLGTMFLTAHAEPALLVEGYTEYPTTDAGRLGLEIIHQTAMAARSDWLQRGGDPAYYTCQEESEQNWDPTTGHPRGSTS